MLKKYKEDNKEWLEGIDLKKVDTIWLSGFIAGINIALEIERGGLDG